MGLREKAGLVLRDPRLGWRYAGWLLQATPTITYAGRTMSGFGSFNDYNHSAGPTRPEIVFMTEARHRDPVAPVFDVGANLGFFSVAMAALGPGSVHAFEPNPGSFKSLQRNCGEIPNVVTHNRAISDQAGLVMMTDDRRAPKLNRISKEGRVTVQAITLASFFAENDIATSPLVKIDVEGAEPLVLRGARTLLDEKRIGAILFEVCEPNLNRMGFAARDLSESLRGYRVMKLDDDGTLVEAPGIPVSPQHINMVAIPA